MIQINREEGRSNMKRITIYDVAKEADVSLATVSRVINGSEVVREDTRVKVQEAIEKLGYKPNAIAQGLALQKTTTIAIVMPGSSFFYTGQIINGLLDTAKIYKYNIMLHSTSSGISEMTDVIESIIKSRVDGVVIFNDKLNREELNTLKHYNVPIVVIGNKMSEDTIGSVYIDYAKLAVKNFELLAETTSPSIKVPLFSKLGLKMAKVWLLNKFRVKTPEEKALKKLVKEYKNKQKISQMINKI